MREILVKKRDWKCEKMRDQKFWTLRYILINVTYFVVFSGIHAYAAVFLLEKGFSNTQIGVALSLANVLSVICQPWIAGIIDQGKTLTNRNVSLASTGILFVGSLLLLWIPQGKAVIFLIFVLIYMIQMVYQPILIAMNFEYREAGCPIYFGLARGLGSVGFAIASFLMGRGMGVHGVSLLMKVDLVSLALAFVILFFFKKPETQENPRGEAGERTRPETREEGKTNVFAFIRAYPYFMLFVAGAVCLFFTHNAINDYMIQIIQPLGGGEKEMGYAVCLAALLELPTMALVDRIIRKISCRWLLLFSGVFFLIKTLLMLMATNMIMVYLSQAMQMFAYAIFIPVSAYYVHEEMKEADQVKGQAYVNCSLTLGGVFSGLFCGYLLDAGGPHKMLIEGLVVTVAGLVIAGFALIKPRKKAQS